MPGPRTVALSVALVATALVGSGLPTVQAQTAPWNPGPVECSGGQCWANGTVLVPAFGNAAANPCDPDDPANGLTNHVWSIPAEFADGDTDFRLENPSTLDTDISFHNLDETTGRCESLGTRGPQGFLGADETGTIPTGAEYVNVDHWAGAGEFVLTFPAECAGSSFC